MYTRLPSLLAPGRRFRRILGAALGAGLLLAAPQVQAQTIYGLGTVTPNNVGQPVGAQGLILIDPTTGATNTFTPTAITGVTLGQTLVGMDYRPNTGQLFALGYDASLTAPTANAQVYTLDPATNAVTAVGAAIRLELGGAADRIGFDFNPTVDRIRVVSTNDANYRLNPGTGGIAFIDGTLAYAGGTPTNPGIGAVAYSNSYIGSTSTTLYDFDELNTTAATTPGNTAILSIQNPPNNGTLTSPLNVMFGPAVTGSPQAIDIDIYYNPTTGVNQGYLTEVTAGGSSNFYAFDVTTGQATLRGNTIPSVIPFHIRDIAVAIAPPTQPALVGQLIYAVAGGNLITFDSGAPGTIRSAVNFGGGLATGQTVMGIDFRPATGQLYALGYNPATTATSIYTVSLTTGNLTAVGTTPNLALGGANDRIGFDFNPTVDRIRVISTNLANFRLNPNDGTLTATDGNLTTGASGAAYTNNQSAPNTTQLFDYDATTGTLYLQNPPNNGTLVSQGSSGLTAATPDGADFDIFNTPNTTTNLALLAVNTNTAAGRTTFDNLYSISLTNGAATNLGAIGFGTNVTGLAAFIQTGTLLTWNGSASTDWLTPANWTPNAVPAANSDVVIPSGTPNQPTISASNGVGKQARNVTLNSGAVLTLADNGVLFVGGNFTNNSGTVAALGTQGNGRVSLTNAGPHTLAGTVTTFPILTVNGATTLGGPVSIRRGLRLGNSLTTTSQTLTLLSDASGTAYLFNTGGGSTTGSITAQRYIDPTRNASVGYRHYSSPVSGNTVLDFATTGYSPEVSQAATYNGAADPTQVAITPFPNIFKYNETRVTTNVPANGSRDFDRGYEVPASTAEPLEAARGYTVNISASALVDFTGTANDGVTPIAVGGLTRGGLPQSGWHLRGNPFPSPIDWQRMIANGRLSGVDNALYVFKSSGQYTGSYGSYIAGVGVNGGSNSLPVGQGFFVRTSTAGTNGSLNFTNAERDTATTALFQRGTADTRPQLTISLSNATVRTQALAYFEQGATAAFDRAFDAVALPNSNGLQLATEAGTELLAINGQPELLGADVLLPLTLSAATPGTYTLAVDNLANLPAAYHAYLRDALTATYTDLAATASLPLSIAANAPASGRYALLFTTQQRVLANAPAALARLASVYPNPAHGSATLLLPVALRGSQATAVSVVDNLGRTVLTRTLAAGAVEALELPLSGLAPGIYSVQAHTAAGLVAKRLVVQ